MPPHYHMNHNVTKYFIQPYNIVRKMKANTIERNKCFCENESTKMNIYLFT